MSLGLLARQPLTWDSEAASYILQVEAADGQSLEPAVARAINTFVIDCKVRGIWGAIKSCCLLSGARTISGAIVPLKGNAPILTSFVGNYNRETGLQRTSGAFNINRNNNADPQNNKHVAVYPTSIDYGSSDSNFRSILTGSTVSGSTFFTVNSLGLSVRVNTSLNIVGNQPVFAGNLIGVSILDSSRSQLLYNSRINIININTTTPVTTDLSLFAGGGVATSLSRVAFYSIGESLDLRLLDQCVSNFNDSLYRLFYPTSLHPEALTWINSAQSNNNPRISARLANALNTFCNSIDSAGLRNKFYRLNLFCGNNLSSCLIPLYRGQSPLVNVGNTTDINNNFILGDYIETGSSGGLKGNGSNKYLSTGITTSIAGVPTITFSSYADSMETSGSSTNFVLVGMLRSNLSFKGAALNSYWNFSTGQRRFDIVGESTGVSPNQPTPLSSTGFISGGHVSGTKYAIFSNGVEINSSNATITTPTGVENSQYFVFARNAPASDGGISPTNFTSSRIKAYHIGTSMTEADQQTFYSIMQAFQTSLERQV